MDKMHHKVKVCNVSYKLILDALSLLKKQFPQDEDIKTRIWQVAKSVDNLQKSIMLSLDVEVTDDEFKNIIKDLENEK